MQLVARAARAMRHHAEDFPYDPAFGEPYNSRERYFAARLGDDAGWLHAGRPRREAVRIALRLCVRSRCSNSSTPPRELARDARGAWRASTADTWLPDQTYLQHAQPSTFGHYLLSLRATRCCATPSGCSTRCDWVNASPGGAGCVNGSRLLDDRSRVARPARVRRRHRAHPRRDVADRRPDRRARQRREPAVHPEQARRGPRDLGEQRVRLRDAGRRLQPVQRPDAAETQPLRAVDRPRRVRHPDRPAHRASSPSTKSPSARSDNLIYAYGEVPRALDLAAAGHPTDERRRAHPDGQRRPDVGRARVGFSQATDLAEYVMQTCGVDYRTAYQVVGDAVREASRDGMRGVDLDGDGSTRPRSQYDRLRAGASPTRT